MVSIGGTQCTNVLTFPIFSEIFVGFDLNLSQIMHLLRQIANFDIFFTRGLPLVVQNHANTNGVRMLNTVCQGFEESYIFRNIGYI